MSRALPLCLSFMAALSIAQWTASISAEEVELEGDLEVIVSDDFEGRRAERAYYVRDRHGLFRIHPAGPQPSHRRTGERVRVKGRLGTHGAHGAEAVEDATVETAAFGPGGADSSSSAAGTVGPLSGTLGEQRTVVLLVTPQQNPLQPYTVEEIRSLIFGTVNDFYREASYQQTWLSGEVFGWFVLPVADICQPSMTVAADQAATAAGIDLSKYRRIIYMQSQLCGTGGWGTIGGSPSRAVISSLRPQVIAHELGHNFGLEHSSSLMCGESVIGVCPKGEYDDPFDTMGGFENGHFNAFQKERLGWLGSQGAPPIAVASASGTHVLGPLETPGTAPRALKVLKDTDPVTGNRVWYYMEYRQPLGFDGFLGEQSQAAVVFHLAVENNPDGMVLWPQPLERLAFLESGGRFVDSEARVIVEVGATNAEQAVLEVTLARPPVATLTSPASAQLVTAPGTTLVLSAQASGEESPVAAVDFLVNGALACRDTAAPYGCNWVVPAGQNVLYSVQAVARDARGVAGEPSALLVSTDLTPPWIVFREPAQDQSVSPGALVNLKVTQGDNLGYAHTDFAVNGTRVARVRATNFWWRIPSYLPNATYEIVATVVDTSGNASSATVTVHAGTGGAAAFQPPMATWTHPLEGETWHPYQYLWVSSEATGTQAIDEVDYLVNDAFVATMESPWGGPNTYSTEMFVAAPAGKTLKLTAIARDVSGVPGAPTSVSVEVGNAPPPPEETQPPAVAIISPASGAGLKARSTVTVSASASDSVGVSRVELRVNGALLGSDAAAPYSWKWSVPGKRGTATVEAKAFNSAGRSASHQITVTIQR